MEKKDSVEKDCIIVYSYKAHVPYIENILWHLRNILENQGFNPILVGSVINSGENYLKTVKEIIKKSLLGIIVLDGFRPNVLLEFGMLLILEKPIIIFLTNEARISIKGLYTSVSDSGLTEKQFLNLRNPQLDISKHLSDWVGNHYIFIDYKHPDSLRDVMNAQFEKMKILLENTEKEVKEYKSTIMQKLNQSIKSDKIFLDESNFPVEILLKLESHKLDFKEKYPKHAENIGKLICAFANHEGGIIYFGISDSKELIGLVNEQKIEERISGLFPKFSTPPKISYKVYYISSERKIIKIEVKKSKKLLQFNSIFYYRDKNSSLTRRLHYEEIESRIMLENRLSNETANILASSITLDKEDETPKFYGKFILKYNEYIEHLMKKYSIEQNPRKYSLIFRQLASDLEIHESDKMKFKEVRQFRNKIIHSNQKISAKQIKNYIKKIEELIRK